MVWLSVGTTNEDFCDKMVDHPVLEAGIIQEAFRNTDRGDFVSEKYRLVILKPYLIHPELFVSCRRKLIWVCSISAPRMHVTVIEELDLSLDLSLDYLS
jgi:hypothetical protein